MPSKNTNRQHFLLELEQGIKLTNREVIHQRFPPVSSDSILSFAVAVAKLRAQYLESAFAFSNIEHPDQSSDEEVSNLRKNRERYEEARDAFEALRQAIDRGYVDLEGNV